MRSLPWTPIPNYTHAIACLSILSQTGVHSMWAMRTHRWIGEDGDDEGWRWASYRNATHPSFWVATAKMPEYFGGSAGNPYQKDDGHAAAGTGDQFMCAAAPAAVYDALRVACAFWSKSRMYAELVWKFAWISLRYRTIFEIVPMPWDWPAEVNYHEAKAFCRWKGALDHTAYRLPTEAEWHVMRGVTAISDVNDDPVMHLRSDPKPAANINLRYGSPSAVDEFAPSPAGFHDTLGNVWEYVEDHFAPLPGFEIHDLYDDFSTPCFDGWHTMIVGGSFISTGDEASYFARFHFRRHFFQHLGFRYVVPSAKEQWPGEASVANLWEGKQDVNTALHNGYAPALDQVLPALPRADLEDSMQYSAQIVRLCSQFRWAVRCHICTKTAGLTVSA